MSTCKEDFPIDIKIKLEETCDEHFESQSNLLTHRHKNCETIRCRICSKEFQSKNAVSRHIKVVHENVKTFQCNNCQKKFSSAAGKTFNNYLQSSRNLIIYNISTTFYLEGFISCQFTKWVKIGDFWTWHLILSLPFSKKFGQTISRSSYLLLSIYKNTNESILKLIKSIIILRSGSSQRSCPPRNQELFLRILFKEVFSESEFWTSPTSNAFQSSGQVQVRQVQPEGASRSLRPLRQRLQSNRPPDHSQETRTSGRGWTETVSMPSLLQRFWFGTSTQLSR